ncbi:MAG: sulfite exporter TauE/SafE family protein [Hyphomicrobiaceae bacterium]|nr:sulfite exporter TauE/SafE family protein [Hyphomicrobiaceae bacterium]
MQTETVLLLLGALAGALVNGLTGFGTGLTALVFWLHAVPPVVAGPLVCACSVVAQVQALPSIWHALDWRRLAPFVVAGSIGVPIGTWLLPRLPVATIKLGLGVLLVVYCSVMLLGRVRVASVRESRGLDALVGLAGGILGGIAGLSGVLPTIWASLRGWPKDARRAVFQGFNLSILSLALASYAMAGLLDAAFLRAFLVALPATVVGSLAGQWLYRRLSDDGFTRVVLMVLLAAGVGLVWGNVG